MNKWKHCLLILGMATMLVACGNTIDEQEIEETEVEITEESTQDDSETEETENTSENISIEEENEDGIDVDLTTLSATMVYAEVYNMYVYPDNYTGKIVKMQGDFSVLEVPETEMIYFSVIIEDALACCSQGIEYELEGEYSYPEDYPEVGEEITVIGEFELYEENGYYYCHLKNAYYE